MLGSGRFDRDGVDGLAEAFAFFDEVGAGVGPHPAGLEGVLDGAGLPALPPLRWRNGSGRAVGSGVL